MAEYLVNFINLFQGLRKTIVMLSVLIITCIFRVKGYVGADNFEGIVKSTVLGFFGVNGIEHYTAMVKEKLNTKGKEVSVTEIEAKGEES